VTDTLTLNGSELLTVIEAEEDRFEVEARYEPHGERPPKHVHPSHEESFTVLTGVLRVGYADQERDYTAGESFEIPRGVAHHMWNAGEEVAVVRWISTPSGRVESFFRAMDALHRAGKNGLVSKAGVLREYTDVMRPVSRVTRLLVQVLGVLRPAAAERPASAGQPALAGQPTSAGQPASVLRPASAASTALALRTARATSTARATEVR